MKKLILALLCITLLASCLGASVAFADTDKAKDVHFISPVGMAVVGDDLFVVDNVADNQSALLCFDVSNEFAHKFTHIFEAQAVNVTSSNGRLFVVFANYFAEYAVQGNALVEIAKYDTFDENSQSYLFANVVDVCVAKLGMMSLTGAKDAIYFLQKNQKYELMFINPDDGSVNSTNMELDNAYSCLSFVYEEQSQQYSYVYIACADESDATKNTLNRYGCYLTWQITRDALNANGVGYIAGFNLTGIADNGLNLPIVYNENSLYTVKDNGGAEGFTAKTPVFNYSSEHTIQKVVGAQGNLYILNSNNQVEIYENVNYSKIGVIGSDVVNLAIPSNFTGFTLAKSTGYPTNIIYKTVGENSIESILTKENVGEFVILDYEGAENCNYYYVLVGDKFGWIKKSDGFAEEGFVDGKISVIKTDVGDDYLTYEADIKFTTLGEVYVYDLPTKNDEVSSQTKLTQTASTQQGVKLLQQFVEDDLLWYLVEYVDSNGNTTRGFVKSSDVGNVRPTLNEDVVIVGDKQINASLFNAVLVYNTEDLLENDLVTKDGEALKLHSGDLVKVVREQNGKAFIQMVSPDGVSTFGWIDAQYLIEVDQIATSAIIGLSALGGAIVLAVVFISVFAKRKKAK